MAASRARVAGVLGGFIIWLGGSVGAHDWAIPPQARQALKKIAGAGKTGLDEFEKKLKEELEGNRAARRKNKGKKKK